MVVRKITAVCAAVLLLTGCKGLRQTVEVPVYLHDTAYTVKEVHDSTVIDRWHTIETKGDTVFVHDSLTLYRYVVRTDTAYQYVEKPVEVVVEKIKEVVKPLTWWQHTLIYIGIGAVVLLVLWVLLRLVLPTKLPTKNGN